MLIPGLSGHEGRVRRALAERPIRLGIASRSDRLGNLIATLDGQAGPTVMLFATWTSSASWCARSRPTA